MELSNLHFITICQSMAFHAFSFGGTTPTITVIVQSAALVGFGSPTTRLSFTLANGVTSEMLSVAGPITDAFWRVSYTVTGPTPLIYFSTVAGIA